MKPAFAPRGFSIPGKVLKLKKSLYGLRQSPRNFFNRLRDILLKNGFKSSERDPCLFIHKHVICLVYVDDLLFFSPSMNHIDEMLENLGKEALKLTKEDDVAGFLGVDLVKHTDGTIEMKQEGLIESIITALDLELANPKETPAGEISIFLVINVLQILIGKPSYRNFLN